MGKFKYLHKISVWLRDFLALITVVPFALIPPKIIAQDTPSNLVKNINAQNAYFGDSFKIN